MKVTWWPWKRRPLPGIDEAQQHIDRLERQQPEVDQLVRELRAGLTPGGTC